jgi:hypothetical protein
MNSFDVPLGSTRPIVKELHEPLVDDLGLLFLGKVPTLRYFGCL